MLHQVILRFTGADGSSEMAHVHMTDAQLMQNHKALGESVLECWAVNNKAKAQALLAEQEERKKKLEEKTL